jgi:hypothetical protein
MKMEIFNLENQLEISMQMPQLLEKFVLLKLKKSCQLESLTQIIYIFLQFTLIEL